MRILIDATATDPGPSGARTRLVHLLSEYVRLPSHHDILVLTPRGRGLTSRLTQHGVECVETDPAPPPFARWRRSATYWDERLRALGGDVLQAETLPVPRVSSPLLLTIHDLRDLARVALFSPRAFYARWLLPGDLRRVSRVIAVSEDTARFVETRSKFPREYIALVPNAPDPGVKRDPDPSLRTALFAKFALPDRFVLALGHLEPRKNLAVLVSAVRSLREDSAFADVGIVACGRDVEGEGHRLREFAARAPAVPLLLTGPLSDDARNALLDLALCVATPSTIEGFGLVPLEAMAAGIPVVAARSGALPEVLGDAALLHDPRDDRELAARLRDAIGDEALRARLVALGVARAARFTWRESALALRDAHDAVAATLDRRDPAM